MPDRWFQTHNLFSPSAVISTVNEPVRGWIDNVYGPIGMIVGVGSGVLHTFQVDISKVVDLVPVDLVVNALLCAAHKVGKTTPTMWVSLVILIRVRSSCTIINREKMTLFVSVIGTLLMFWSFEFMLQTFFQWPILKLGFFPLQFL